MRRLLLILTTACIGLTGYTQIPQRVADIFPGSTSSNPNVLTAIGGNLYFCASDSLYGHELWKYNGTGAPTRLSDIYASASDGAPNYNTATGLSMARLGSKIYFTAINSTTGTELYSYDTVTGLVAVAADIIPGATGAYPLNLLTVGNKLFFTASTSKAEVYSYDGVNPPTLYNVNNSFGSMTPDRLVNFNGKVYFSGSDSIHGKELFVIDPVAGTSGIAYDIESGLGSSSPYSFTVAGNKMYFAAYTGSGVQLFSYDGSTATQLTNLNISGAYGGFPYYKGCIYFTIAGTGKLYKYTIATGAASLVYDVYPSNNADIKDYVVYNDAIYFTATTASGNELWRCNDTTCTMVVDLNPGVAGSSPASLTVWNGSLYFTATDSVTGRELYTLTAGLGVQKTSFDGSIAAYPNPAHGNLVISVSLVAAASLNIGLTDASGKTVYASGPINYKAGVSKYTIPVTALSPGQYFYHVEDPNSRQLAGGMIEVTR